MTLKVKEIPFVGRVRPSGVKPIINLNTLGWSGPITLPAPVYFNGVACDHIVISRYGAVRFTQAATNGKWQYWYSDKTLPASIEETQQGWMIIPWGELIKVKGCGIAIYLYEADGNVIIDYDVKSSYDSRSYLFRMEFPLREPDIARCYYYHCVSGYNTYIGVVKKPDDVVSWDLKENQPYMKKALEFDVSKEIIDYASTPFPPSNNDAVNDPVEPEPEPTQPSPPAGPEVPKPSDSDTNEWRTVYEINDVNYAYRLQTRLQL